MDLDAVNRLHQQLREQTHSAHMLAERHSPFLAPNLSRARYQMLLWRLGQFWLAFEKRIERDLNHSPYSHSDYKDHFRAHLIRHDLQVLNGASSSDCPIEPMLLQGEVSTGGWLGALGCLYVLAGSRVGGGVVGRHLKRHLDPYPADAISFWLADIHQARPALLRLLRQIDALGLSQGQEAKIIAAAQATFRTYSSWMGGFHFDSNP